MYSSIVSRLSRFALERLAGSRLPPVPSAGSLGTAQHEAKQPEHKDDEREPPQEVQGESEPKQKDRENQHRDDDDGHVCFLPLRVSSLRVFQTCPDGQA
jgi:hypothetical protein